MLKSWCCEQPGCNVRRSNRVGFGTIAEWAGAVVFHLEVCRMIGGVESKAFVGEVCRVMWDISVLGGC